MPSTDYVEITTTKNKVFPNNECNQTIIKLNEQNLNCWLKVKLVFGLNGKQTKSVILNWFARAQMIDGWKSTVINCLPWLKWPNSSIACHYACICKPFYQCFHPMNIEYS